MAEPDLDLLLAGVEGVSFDFDGTLASTLWRKFRMWPGVLRHPVILGSFGPAVGELRGRRCLDARSEICRLVTARTGGEPDTVHAVLEAEIEGRWPSLFADAQVPPRVAELLKETDRRGLPRVVVSDYPAIAKLDQMGLGGWMAIIDCRELGALKPLPDGLWAAAALLGLPPGQILHVGNRWDTDGAAAAAAGCRFVHVDELAKEPHAGTDGSIRPRDGR